MSDRKQRCIARLNDSRTRLVGLIEKIADRGEEQIYSEGAQWTLRQLAIHLAIADKGHHNMVMSIARGEELIPENYDIDRFNKRSVEKSDAMSIHDALESLEQSRATFLKWFEDIDDNVLDKQGRHATLQILSIEQIIGVMAQHEMGHANDIEAILEP